MRLSSLPYPLRPLPYPPKFMFEPETEKETEQSRSRLVMVLGAVGALALAVVVVLLSRSSHNSQPVTPAQALPGGTQAKLEDAVRSGAPEFESYKAQIVIDEAETLASQNMLGMTQFIVKGRLLNRGNRTLTGVELAAKVYSLDEKVVAQNTSLPIPRLRTEPLKPGDSMRVTIKVDTPSNITEDMVMKVVPEVSGLRFQ